MFVVLDPDYINFAQIYSFLTKLPMSPSKADAIKRNKTNI